MQTSNQTLAQIVADRPETAPILVKYRLDFCCNGRHTLQEACNKRGIDHTMVELELSTAAPAAVPIESWASRPLDQLIDRIVSHYHEGLRRDIPIALRLARTVERVHRDHPRCPIGLAEHLARIQDDVESHLLKEEQILFPMILAGNGSKAVAPIEVMEKEHVQHGANLARTRLLTGDFQLPDNACASWKALYDGLSKLEQDLFEHIHLENYVLFPRALTPP